jgi:hypothetical protein
VEVKGKGLMEVFHLESATQGVPFASVPGLDSPAHELVGVGGVQGGQAVVEDESLVLRSTCLLPCASAATPEAPKVCVGLFGVDGPLACLHVYLCSAPFLPPSLAAPFPCPCHPLCFAPLFRCRSPLLSRDVSYISPDVGHGGACDAWCE